MSVTILPRELGAVLCCNGCDKTLRTAQILKGAIRAYATTIGWGRGLRRKNKRRDLCDDCMPGERELVAKQKEKREKRRLERDEKARAKQKPAEARA